MSGRESVLFGWYARFWRHVDKSGDCWLWTGATHSRPRFPYGKFGIDGTDYVAHRVAWLAEHGTIPHGKLVLHRCDTPRCVRVDHLFVGTASENMRDMISKGRGRGQFKPGELHWNAVLTDDAVRTIRREADHTPYTELAQHFLVSLDTIKHVASGKGWAHV